MSNSNFVFIPSRSHLSLNTEGSLANFQNLPKLFLDEVCISQNHKAIIKRTNIVVINAQKALFLQKKSMNAVFKIPIADLTQTFIRDLKAKYGEAELEINVRPKAKREILSESEFWKILDFLNWEKSGDDVAVIEPVVQYLSSLPVSFIYQFQDKLSEKLYLLDTQVHAENCGHNAYAPDQPFSVDVFLYERCCVVANGRAFYEEVLNDPSKMLTDLTFEPLLHIAGEAFERKTGKRLAYLPAYNYETFSNEEGWTD